MRLIICLKNTLIRPVPAVLDKPSENYSLSIDADSLFKNFPIACDTIRCLNPDKGR